jgi:signal transduction histidine kinase/CheY-like chemotaxis protein
VTTASAVSVSSATADRAALLQAPGEVQPNGSARDMTADYVRTLHLQTPIAIAASVTALVIIAWMFVDSAPPLRLWSWTAFVFSLIAARGWLYTQLPGGYDVPLEKLVAWRRRWNAVVLLSAAAWGAAVWLFYRTGSPFHAIGLILIVYCYMLGGVQLMATQPRANLAFLCLGMMPIIARIALDSSDPYHLELAGILLMLFGLTLMLSTVYRRALQSTIELKVQTEHLAAQLKREKADADAARRAAEVANRAKTQFFAAASHDLRQPLHALGLFAEALRQRSHDEEAVQLVNSINSSVDALEGLFSELLDITKIDTGGVEPQPAHVHVGDLFRRLRLHFEPTAFEKGLALRFRGDAHHVHADPVLVDRILRNLLSNAIRYTNDGSVLVSCRRRRDKLLLQVWDTGVGIRPREQERIFEEFYQVSSDTKLEAHQRKGLGLGLAIVKRLAALMDAPLTLRSQPGRGTVFTLELPVGRAVRADDAVPAGKPMLRLTLERRRIVIVEDEPSVRGGLEVLLKSWGADVLSFDSVEACSAWARDTAPDTPAPDLLIVDYRLESGHTGVEAISALRKRFAAQLPAIVVTGSTMTGHDSEAQQHDFHLLVKPVVPNKLRAMIAFKLNLR